MTRPRIALGIPVYNQVGTIEATVRSALDQTLPFHDIVVADNHSTDGTSERLAAFTGRVRIVRPPKHLGMVQNWNFCSEQLNAEWFSLLSGDDLLKPHFVSKVSAAIAEHSDAALIRTDWDVIDGQGLIKSARRQLSVARVTRPPKTWQEQIHGPKVSFAAFAARHDLWRAVGGFPAEFHLFQDWMFWLKLAPLGDFVRIPESLAQYRSVDRPDLEPGRALPRLEDEYRYAMEVIPALPWRGVFASRQIRKARAARFIDLLNFLSRYPQTLEVNDSTAKLERWAQAANMQPTYRRWIADGKPVAPTLSKRLSSMTKTSIRRLLDR